MAYLDYMMNNSGFAGSMGETEEERRARLERERLAAMQAPTAPVKPTPVKETITIDPVTGERKIKIEGSERDLSALNPRTPTVSMPNAMTNLAPDLSRMPPITNIEDYRLDANGVPAWAKQPAQAPTQTMPQAAPAAPVSPDQFRFENLTPDQITSLESQMGQMGINDRGILRRPDAAEMFNQRPLADRQRIFAASQPTPAQGQMVRTGAPAVQPQPQPAMGQGITAQGGVPTTTTGQIDYTNLLVGAQANDNIRNKMITDPATPAPERMAAIQIDRRDAERQRETGAAQKEIQEAERTGNYNALMRRIKKETEGGSVLKALFYKAIGMTNLALEEEKKMGAGRKWQTVIDPKTNQRALVEYDADGLPLGGFDSAGKALSNEQLAAFGAGGGAFAKAETGKTLYRDPTNTVKGVITATFVPGRTTPIYTDQTGAIVQPGSLTPITAATDVPTAYQRSFVEGAGRTQGTAAGEGYTVSPVPPAPGVQGVPGSAQAPAAAPAGQPAQAAPAAPVPPTTVAQPPAGAAPAQPVAPGQAPNIQPFTPQTSPALGAPSGAPAAAPAGAPLYQQRQAAEAQAGAAAEAAKTPALVSRADQESFVKYKNEDILPKADSGAKLAGIRRDQISGPDGVLNNPEIAGLLSGTGSQAREFQNIFRDVVGGNFEKIDDMSARIKQANLEPRMKEVLQIQLQRQREVTPLLIREVAPVGTITDFEQRMAKDAGIDILRQGLYAGLTNLTRSQFQSDMAAYQRVFQERNPQLATRSQFDAAWNKEKSRLDAAYRKVYEDRAKYIGRYNKDGSNNNATVVAFRDHYPVPRFDQGTGQWVFEGFSRQAERPPLSSFERR